MIDTTNESLINFLTCISFALVYLLLLWAVYRLLIGSPQKEPMPEIKGVQPHIAEAFWKFHQENPQIWDLFVRFTKEVVATGREHYGVAAVFERIRWHVNVETKDEDFKLNNNYRSCYARLLMQEHPELGAVFQTRTKREVLDV